MSKLITPLFDITKTPGEVSNQTSPFNNSQIISWVSSLASSTIQTPILKEVIFKHEDLSYILNNHPSISDHESSKLPEIITTKELFWLCKKLYKESIKPNPSIKRLSSEEFSFLCNTLKNFPITSIFNDEENKNLEDDTTFLKRMAYSLFNSIYISEEDSLRLLWSYKGDLLWNPWLKFSDNIDQLKLLVLEKLLTTIGENNSSIKRYIPKYFKKLSIYSKLNDLYTPWFTFNYQTFERLNNGDLNDEEYNTLIINLHFLKAEQELLNTLIDNYLNHEKFIKNLKDQHKLDTPESSSKEKKEITKNEDSNSDSSKSTITTSFKDEKDSSIDNISTKKKFSIFDKLTITDETKKKALEDYLYVKEQSLNEYENILNKKKNALTYEKYEDSMKLKIAKKTWSLRDEQFFKELKGVKTRKRKKSNKLFATKNNLLSLSPTSLNSIIFPLGIFTGHDLNRYLYTQLNLIYNKKETTSIIRNYSYCQFIFTLIKSLPHILKEEHEISPLLKSSLRPAKTILQSKNITKAEFLYYGKIIWFSSDELSKVWDNSLSKIFNLKGELNSLPDKLREKVKLWENIDGDGVNKTLKKIDTSYLHLFTNFISSNQEKAIKVRQEWTLPSLTDQTFSLFNNEYEDVLVLNSYSPTLSTYDVNLPLFILQHISKLSDFLTLAPALYWAMPLSYSATDLNTLFDKQLKLNTDERFSALLTSPGRSQTTIGTCFGFSQDRVSEKITKTQSLFDKYNIKYDIVHTYINLNNEIINWKCIYRCNYLLYPKNHKWEYVNPECETTSGFDYSIETSLSSKSTSIWYNLNKYISNKSVITKKGKKVVNVNFNTIWDLLKTINSASQSKGAKLAFNISEIRDLVSSVLNGEISSYEFINSLISHYKYINDLPAKSLINRDEFNSWLISTWLSYLFPSKDEIKEYYKHIIKYLYLLNNNKDKKKKKGWFKSKEYIPTSFSYWTIVDFCTNKNLDVTKFLSIASYLESNRYYYRWLSKYQDEKSQTTLKYFDSSFFLKVFSESLNINLSRYLSDKAQENQTIKWSSRMLFNFLQTNTKNNENLIYNIENSKSKQYSYFTERAHIYTQFNLKKHGYYEDYSKDLAEETKMAYYDHLKYLNSKKENNENNEIDLIVNNANDNNKDIWSLTILYNQILKQPEQTMEQITTTTTNNFNLEEAIRIAQENEILQSMMDPNYTSFKKDTYSSSIYSYEENKSYAQENPSNNSEIISSYEDEDYEQLLFG